MCLTLDVLIVSVLSHALATDSKVRDSEVGLQFAHVEGAIYHRVCDWVGEIFKGICSP